jgi:hypothetical protein
MSTVVTVRLPDEAAAEIKRIARRERRSQSEVGARALEEWLRMERFPYIEFRSFSGDRQACIKGRLQVWQVIMIAKAYDMALDKTAEHLRLRSEQVQNAFDYYTAFPQEIDDYLELNRQGVSRLKQMFPHLEVFTVTDEMLESVEFKKGTSGEGTA